MGMLRSAGVHRGALEHEGTPSMILKQYYVADAPELGLTIEGVVDALAGV
jgi:hypothetical protein